MDPEGRPSPPSSPPPSPTATPTLVTVGTGKPGWHSTDPTPIPPCAASLSPATTTSALDPARASDTD